MTLKGQTQMISNIVSVALNRTFLPLLWYKHYTRHVQAPLCQVLRKLHQHYRIQHCDLK